MKRDEWSPSIIALGDFNADGVGDLLCGARFADGPGNGRSAAGEAYVLFGISTDIAVEQPVGVSIVPGGSRDFGLTAPGAPVNLTFTIKNPSTASLIGLVVDKVGSDATQFLVTTQPTTPVAPGGSTTFVVQFAPTTGGVKTADLLIASNVAAKSPFPIGLAGQALSLTADTDGDGLNDTAEFLLAPLGFNGQTNQSALVNTYYTHANAARLYTQAQYDAQRTAGRNDVLNSPNPYGLYTLSQVQALHVGKPLLQRDVAGVFTLTIGVQKSTDLLQFVPFAIGPSQISLDGQGRIRFQFTVPDNAAFFRVQAQ